MCLFKSCIRHQPLKMLEQDCRFVTRWKQMLILKKTQVLEKSESFCSSPYAELSKALMRVPGSVHTSVCPTVCQHSRRLLNCLPSSPKMAQPSANIAQLFAINVIHRPTVCQLCRTRTNCLPTSCHSDHQIKSVRFLFGFVVFLFFHRLSAGSFIYLNDGSRNFGNLNMNGECIVRLYFLCFGYDCILLSF